MHTVTSPTVSTRVALTALALGLFAGPSLTAQTAADPKAASGADAGDTMVLSPFYVDSSEDVGYQANSTLAGTRIRTDLKDVASAISVVTSQFLKDTGARKAEDLLIYTTNTEVGGIHGNFSGTGGGVTYNENSNLLRPSNNTRVRGLDSADNTRDYFLTEIPWDSFNVDRVDLQRGPNSILFGVGSPAGIINTSLNAASFRDANKVESRIDKYGSFRESLDLNYVARKNELAFRVAALDDDTKYQQKPAFNHDRRLYGAVRYDPQLFKNGHTTIRANFEDGKVTANRPRSLAPIDGITPWFLTGTSNGFQNLNKLTLDPNTTWNQYGNNPAYPNSTYPWFREAFQGRMFNSDMGLFYNANSSAPTLAQTPTIGTPLGIDSTGAIDGTIGGIEFARPWAIGTYNAYARAAIPGGKYYSNVSLTDPTIFDFYNKLIDGPNKKEWQNWKAANVAVSQTFFDERLGFELVYDRQRYDDGQYQFLNGDQYKISVDINTKLLDGSANPNVGRPYVADSGQFAGNQNFIDRDSLRFTGTGELRAKDFLGNSWLGNVLGRHVFTGILSEDRKRTDFRQFSRWATDPAFTDATGQVGDITNGLRQVDWIAYLGPSLASASSAHGAGLSNVSAVIDPSGSQTLRYFDSHWNAPNVNPAAAYTYTTHDANGNLVTNTGTQADNPANYVGWTSRSFNVLNAENPNDLAQLYTSGTRAQNVIKSSGIVWQGYLLNGDLVPVFGWREDRVKNASSQAPKGSHQVAIMTYDVDTSPANTREVIGRSKSWGAVYHLPKAITSWIPGPTQVSLFYNHSQNFKADAPRGDIFGNQIANPDGQTKDYGVAITTLNDRLTFKVNRYETKVKNASLQADSAGFSGSLYYVWALPYWGATHALAALDGIADPQLRQGSWGWPWNGIAVDSAGNPDKARIGTIVKDFFTNFPLDQHFADEYGLGMNIAKMHSTNQADWYAAIPQFTGAANLGLQPAYSGNLRDFGAGPVASVDTVSKGIEIESTAKLTKNWDLTLNASKTDATRSAISPTIDAWIQTYTKFLAGDAGLIRLWGGDPIRTVWATQVLAPYQVLKAQTGSQAPEVPKWRFNLISTYTFDHGAIKGAYAGGAYRWEDRRILGYHYDAKTDLLNVTQPWYGPTDSHVDLWAGYGFKLTKQVHWRIQLNLRNVGEHAGLVPVTMQPDGSIALSRIKEGMTWQLTNTFEF